MRVEDHNQTTKSERGITILSETFTMCDTRSPYSVHSFVRFILDEEYMRYDDPPIYVCEIELKKEFGNRIDISARLLLCPGDFIHLFSFSEAEKVSLNLDFCKQIIDKLLDLYESKGVDWKEPLARIREIILGGENESSRS